MSSIVILPLRVQFASIIDPIGKNVNPRRDVLKKRASPAPSLGTGAQSIDKPRWGLGRSSASLCVACPTAEPCRRYAPESSGFCRRWSGRWPDLQSFLAACTSKMDSPEAQQRGNRYLHRPRTHLRRREGTRRKSSFSAGAGRAFSPPSIVRKFVSPARFFAVPLLRPQAVGLWAD